MSVYEEAPIKAMGRFKVPLGVRGYNKSPIYQIGRLHRYRNSHNNMDSLIVEHAKPSI